MSAPRLPQSVYMKRGSRSDSLMWSGRWRMHRPRSWTGERPSERLTTTARRSSWPKPACRTRVSGWRGPVYTAMDTWWCVN